MGDTMRTTTMLVLVFVLSFCFNLIGGGKHYLIDVEEPEENNVEVEDTEQNNVEVEDTEQNNVPGPASSNRQGTFTNCQQRGRQGRCLGRERPPVIRTGG